MVSLCSYEADSCIYEHSVSTVTGLLFVGFLQRCTVKIVFKEYSKVELAVTVAKRIHPLIYFTFLMDNQLPALAFQEKWEENKAQWSLILFLLQTPLGSTLYAHPHLKLLISTTSCWPQT